VNQIGDDTGARCGASTLNTQTRATSVRKVHRSAGVIVRFIRLLLPGAARTYCPFWSRTALPHGTGLKAVESGLELSAQLRPLAAPPPIGAGVKHAHPTLEDTVCAVPRLPGRNRAAAGSSPPTASTTVALAARGSGVAVEPSRLDAGNASGAEAAHRWLPSSSLARSRQASLPRRPAGRVGA